MLQEPPPPPEQTVLDYARPQVSATAAVVVRASPAGVLLRVTRPWWPTELLKVFIYLIGVLLIGAMLLMAALSLRDSRGAQVQWSSYFCSLVALAIWVSFVVQLLVLFRDIGRIIRRDPRLGTRFFHAADATPSWRVDPVKSVELHREPMGVTFRRPHALRIITRRSRQFTC
jgi:hypothetical protein